MLGGRTHTYHQFTGSHELKMQKFSDNRYKHLFVVIFTICRKMMHNVEHKQQWFCINFWKYNNKRTGSQSYRWTKVRSKVQQKLRPRVTGSCLNEKRIIRSWVLKTSSFSKCALDNVLKSDNKPKIRNGGRV